MHCQRTHLTCDNNRPCERCVARGLADTCRDGVRKKAKYLNDVPEELAHSEEANKYDPRYKKQQEITLPHVQIVAGATSVTAVTPVTAATNHLPSTGSSLHITVTRDDNEHELEVGRKLSAINMDMELDVNGSTSIDAAASTEMEIDSEAINSDTPNPIAMHPHRKSSSVASTKASNAPMAVLSGGNVSGGGGGGTAGPSEGSNGIRKARRHSTFESPALNLEYSVISDMLRGNAITNTNPQMLHSGASPAFSDDSNASSMYSGPGVKSGSGVNLAIAGAGNAATASAGSLNQYLLTNSPNHNFSELLASLEPTRQQQSRGDWLTTDAKPRPISFAIADVWDENGSSSASEFDWGNMTPQLQNVFSPHQQQQQQQQQPHQQLSDFHSPYGTSIQKPYTYTSSSYEKQTYLSPHSHANTNHHKDALSHDNASEARNAPRKNASTKPHSLTSATRKRPGDIYTNVKNPFAYTLGYRRLFRYLKQRFEREQMIQMAQCMSRYRPSFIACTNSLDRDDLVFMEQCFQRTLLEYEKYIGASGTPTAVWRRTGQIAAVGKEFCILTGWSRKQLLHRDGPQDGQGMFIVEVMQDESVLEYFQMFSDISFGDSRDAMMSECMLRSATGQTIRTASIWTLKRDVFGIPMMIIGNFLPILS